MNTETMEIIGFTLGMVTILFIVCYLACRAIGYWFYAKESRLDYEHEKIIHGIDNQEAYDRQLSYQTRMYEDNRRLMNGFTDRVRNLSMDVIQTINQNRLNQAKAVMDDSANFMKRMCELEREFDE